MKVQKIKDIFPKRMSFSFEMFPPKVDQPIEPLLDTLNHLYKFDPDFISITYGAGGTNKGRNVELCKSIVDSDVCAMTHFTCIGNTREDIAASLKEYQEIGVRNILALRGDLPKGWTGTGGDFEYATDLISFIREVAPDFCIDGACSPEKHIQAPSLETDIMHLRTKVEEGADFLTTQLFYDNEQFYRFRDQIRKAGIKVPVVVGVMPVLALNPTIRMTTSNGCSISKEVSAIIAKYPESPEDFKKAGIEYTVNQITDLVNHGIDGLHLYALNKWEDISVIVNQTGIRRYKF